MELIFLPWGEKVFPEIYKLYDLYVALKKLGILTNDDFRKKEVINFLASIANLNIPIYYTVKGKKVLDSIKVPDDNFLLIQKISDNFPYGWGFLRLHNIIPKGYTVLKVKGVLKPILVFSSLEDGLKSSWYYFKIMKILKDPRYLILVDEIERFINNFE